MAIPDTFYYHQVDAGTSDTMADLRHDYIALAEHLDAVLPESRSRSLALTHLEDSLMRAIQCLAVSHGEKIV